MPLAPSTSDQGSSGSDPGINPQLLEAQAAQLNQASTYMYGQPVNPQLAYESMVTGASPAVVSAIYQAGNSKQAQSLFASSPAGLQPYANQAPPVVPTQNLYSFDPNAYKQALDPKSDLGKKWQSVGGLAPQLNTGWMQYVQNSDPSTIRQWQQYLQRSNPAVKVSGIWDTATKGTFNGWMMSYVMPFALYGSKTDPNLQGQARQLIDQLQGPGASDAFTKMLRDPQFQREVALRWVTSDGPDVTPGSLTSLQDFANNFGQENLPDAYRNLEKPDSILDVVNSTPILGWLTSGVTNLFTGAPGSLQNPKERAALAGFTQDQQLHDSEILQPAIQQIKQNQGLMGVFDWWDQEKNGAILALYMASADALSGKGFDIGNAFDPNSAMGLQIAAKKDDLVTDIWGKDFADSPLGFITQFAVNTLDDPLTYLTFGGSALAKSSLKGAAKLMSEGGLKYMADNPGLRNKQLYQLLHFDALPQVAEKHGMGRVMNMLQIEHGALPEQMKAIDTVLDTTKPYEERLNVFKEAFPQVAGGFKNAYTTHIHLKNLKALMAGSLDGERANKAYSLWGIKVWGSDLRPEVVKNPAQFISTAEKYMTVAGYDSATIAKRLQELWTAKENPTDLISKAQHLMADIKDDFNKAHPGFEADFNKFKAGNAWSQEMGVSGVGTRAMMVDKAGKEMSVAGRGGAKAADIKKLEDEIANTEEKLKTASGTQKADLENTLRKLQEQRTASTGPVPAYSAQLDQTVDFPYPLSSMVLLTNPYTRRMEQTFHLLHLDAFNTAWKRLAIARVSTAMRVGFGEDQIRVFSDLLFHNPIAAVDYLAHGLASSAKIAGTFPVRAVGGAIRSDKLASAGIKGAQEEISKAKEEFQGIDRILTEFMQSGGAGGMYGFGHYRPEDPGYFDKFMQHITFHQQTPELQAWLKEMEFGDEKKAYKGYVKWLKQSEPGKEILAAHQLTTKQASVWAKKFHDFHKTYYSDPRVRRLMLHGSTDKQAQNELKQVLRTAEPGTLPTIVHRIPNPWTDNMFTNAVFQRYPQFMHDVMMEPVVDLARARGFKLMQAEYLKSLVEEEGGKIEKGIIKGMDGPRADYLRQIATQRGIGWMKSNTYQGERSVMGSAVRNVFPFWGATANMNRFWLRQAATHAGVGNVVARTAIGSSNAIADQLTGSNQNNNFSLPWFGGDAMQVNPSHMFFLSSDGIASMVPGMGPVMSYLANVPKAQGYQDVAQQVPILGQSLQYQQGEGELFPWLSDVISGAMMAVTGSTQTPQFSEITRSNQTEARNVNARIKELEAQGKTVSPADIEQITREVGGNMVAQGIGRFLLPLNPTVVHPDTNTIETAMDQYRQQATLAEKDAFLAQQFGMDVKTLQQKMNDGTILQTVKDDPHNPGVLMLYQNNEIPPATRDAIASTYAPWVVPYSTSSYNTAQSGPIRSLQQFRQMQAAGNIQSLQPNEYLTSVDKVQQYNQGWLGYENLVSQKDALMAQMGWTPQNAQYKAWKAQVYDPQVLQLEAKFPQWGAQFSQSGGMGQDVISLETQTAPLRALQTWEVIPQHDDYNNKVSNLWREALVAKDQAASNISQIKASGGNSAEEEMVMVELANRLQELSKEDPIFATQLSRYSYRKWQDVVNLQAEGF